MKAFDAIVAGAGPAGAVAARDLARAGARVALVDGSHPREKPCGGGVTGRALQLVGSTIGNRGSGIGDQGSGIGDQGSGIGDQGSGIRDRDEGQRIDAVTFEADGRRARVILPDPDYLRVVSREDFDRALLRQAIDAGATHIASRVGSVARAAAGWNIEAGGQAISAPWLLGADGPAGVVRKQVFRPFERRQLSIAAGSYVDGVDIGEMVIRFVDEPRGYLWSFPRRGHLAVGTCGQANETTTAEMHAVTDRWLDGYAPAAGLPRRRYAWPIPSLEANDVDAEQPAGDGWMLLGDAAGLVDPITREGIFFALRSGMLAAAALTSGSPARAYGDAVRDELHDELRRAARLKAGFFRPRFTSMLVDALNQSAGIRHVMLDLVAGRQPYRGLKRRLVGTMEVGLMWRVLTT